IGSEQTSQEVHEGLDSFVPVIILFFFFQAEDGIRDGHVTGVQTCALPISSRARISAMRPTPRQARARAITRRSPPTAVRAMRLRSEERRVGKEWRSRWAAGH